MACTAALWRVDGEIDASALGCANVRSLYGHQKSFLWASRTERDSLEACLGEKTHLHLLLRTSIAFADVTGTPSRSAYLYAHPRSLQSTLLSRWQAMEVLVLEAGRVGYDKCDTGTIMWAWTASRTRTLPINMRSYEKLIILCSYLIWSL